MGTGSRGWVLGAGGRYLASVVVDDEAGVPAVEVLVRSHLALQLLQQREVGPLALGVHGGAHVVQDAHDAGGVLRPGLTTFNLMLFNQIKFLL